MRNALVTLVVITWCAPLFGAPCGEPAVLLSEVQGSGLQSPREGEVVTVEATVSAVFPGLDGYFIAEEPSDVDDDARTSEGLFVHHPGVVPSIGERVRVTGTVTEFHELTELTDVTAFAICGTVATPRPTQLVLPVESLAVFESLEGMLLELSAPLFVVGGHELGRYGELVLASERLAQPTDVVSPGPEAAAWSERNLLSSLQLDDGAASSFPTPIPHVTAGTVVRAGDEVEALTGVLGYAFGKYELHPTAKVQFRSKNPRPNAPELPSGALRVASLNVYNYFLTLDAGGARCGPDQSLECRGATSAVELARQREKLLAALTGLDADIVALLEVENGGKAASDLAAGLGGYRAVQTGALGTDAIQVALLYRPAVVDLLGDFAVLDASVDPRFDDRRNRPVLAQSFAVRATGDRLTVLVNHLKSKGSSCDDAGDPDTNDGQGACNGTRLAAVQAELDWLASDPTGTGTEHVLALGDFNAYAREDPVTAWLERGYVRLKKDGAYTYIYDGLLGSLDHAFASPALAEHVTGFDVWHINADELPLRDYRASNAADWYEPGPFRSSDHDPVVIGLFGASRAKGAGSVRLGGESRREIRSPRARSCSITDTQSTGAGYFVLALLGLLRRVASRPLPQ